MYEKALTNTSQCTYGHSTTEFLHVLQEISRKNKKLLNSDRASSLCVVVRRESTFNSAFMSIIAAEFITFSMKK